MTVNGVNPHSVLVMDNCSIHHVNTTVYEVGALVHFLPPYSPDDYPIEEAFSKVKGQFKVMDIDSLDDPQDFMMTAFATMLKIVSSGLGMQGFIITFNFYRCTC